MAIDITDSTEWLLATDATAIFHEPSDGTDKQFTTGQPYVMSGVDEDEVVAKVFVSPVRDSETNEYIFDDLTPKLSGDIIAAATYTDV